MERKRYSNRSAVSNLINNIRKVDGTGRRVFVTADVSSSGRAPEVWVRARTASADAITDTLIRKGFIFHATPDIHADMTHIRILARDV